MNHLCQFEVKLVLRNFPHSLHIASNGHNTNFAGHIYWIVHNYCTSKNITFNKKFSSCCNCDTNLQQLSDAHNLILAFCKPFHLPDTHLSAVDSDISDILSNPTKLTTFLGNPNAVMAQMCDDKLHLLYQALAPYATT